MARELALEEVRKASTKRNGGRCKAGARKPSSKPDDSDSEDSEPEKSAAPKASSVKVVACSHAKRDEIVAWLRDSDEPEPPAALLEVFGERFTNKGPIETLRTSLLDSSATCPKYRIWADAWNSIHTALHSSTSPAVAPLASDSAVASPSLRLAPQSGPELSVSAMAMRLVEPPRASKPSPLARLVSSASSAPRRLCSGCSFSGGGGSHDATCSVTRSHPRSSAAFASNSASASCHRSTSVVDFCSDCNTVVGLGDTHKTWCVNA